MYLIQSVSKMLYKPITTSQKTKGLHSSIYILCNLKLCLKGRTGKWYSRQRQYCPGSLFQLEQVHKKIHELPFLLSTYTTILTAGPVLYKVQKGCACRLNTARVQLEMFWISSVCWSDWKLGQSFQSSESWSRKWLSVLHAWFKDTGHVW